MKLIIVVYLILDIFFSILVNGSFEWIIFSKWWHWWYFSINPRGAYVFLVDSKRAVEVEWSPAASHMFTVYETPRRSVNDTDLTAAAETLIGGRVRHTLVFVTGAAPLGDIIVFNCCCCCCCRSRWRRRPCVMITGPAEPKELQRVVWRTFPRCCKRLGAAARFTL